MTASDRVAVAAVVVGDQVPLVSCAGLPVPPDACGQGQQPLRAADHHAGQGPAAVAYQPKLVLEGVEGALDPLPEAAQRAWPRRPRARRATHPAAVQLPVEGSLPSLVGATEWLDSPPLTAAGLRGSVVLVDFWTYTCINWLRTLPCAPGPRATTTRVWWSSASTPPSWGLGGGWTVGRQAVGLHEAGGRIADRFHARGLNLVMAPRAPGSLVRFRVGLDGQPWARPTGPTSTSRATAPAPSRGCASVPLRRR
jgi:hypothetical protein